MLKRKLLISSLVAMSLMMTACTQTPDEHNESVHSETIDEADTSVVSTDATDPKLNSDVDTDINVEGHSVLPEGLDEDQQY